MRDGGAPVASRCCTISGSTAAASGPARRRRTASNSAGSRPGIPGCRFILAHIGGGGDWLHTLRAARTRPNVYLDLSGSGVDGGMLDAALAAVGAERLLWGADVTLCTGLAKLRYLEQLLGPADCALVTGGNAARIFPPGSFA